MTIEIKIENENLEEIFEEIPAEIRDDSIRGTIIRTDPREALSSDGDIDAFNRIYGSAVRDSAVNYKSSNCFFKKYAKKMKWSGCQKCTVAKAGCGFLPVSNNYNSK